MAAAQEVAAAAAKAAKKSAPGQPWSHMETMHLIDAYEESWTKLHRGQLKAQQWEDVAAEVAARCAGAAHRKTGTQCRHKVEKLRKRYRTESARPVTSLWPYFRRMERLERGPLPVSAFPPPAVSPPTAASDDEEEEEEDDDVLLPRNNTRSINGLLRESGGFSRGFTPRQPRPPPQQQPPPAVMLSTAPPRKRVACEAFQAKAVADRVKEEETPLRRSGGGGVDAQFSAVLRDFGEGIMRLERRRMDVQWDIDREWKETEARHKKMLLDAQRQLHETLAAASAARAPAKKAKRDHGSSGDGSVAS